VIYFLRCMQDTHFLIAGDIKIGTTTRLSIRLKQIAADIGHMPTVLAVLDGAFAEEHALHIRFVSDHRYGEWFEPCKDLLRLIETEGQPWDGIDEKPSGLARIDADVLEDVRLIATFRKISISEYLSEVVRPVAKRDLEAELARRSHSMAEEKKRK
jgi:hypothetical protein